MDFSHERFKQNASSTVIIQGLYKLHAAGTVSRITTMKEKISNQNKDEKKAF